jgi:hypothetical protein
MVRMAVSTIPHDDGCIPNDVPETRGYLLVAGKENLPRGNENSWNEAKSHNLLRFDGSMMSQGKGKASQTF